tara:strand:- start:531 stop:737 length:207 start_codon:yes stop_codon:yes gene_type:complete
MTMTNSQKDIIESSYCEGQLFVLRQVLKFETPLSPELKQFLNITLMLTEKKICDIDVRNGYDDSEGLV